MKEINTLLLSINEGTKLRNFPSNKWAFEKNKEEVVVSTSINQEGSKSKIKLSIIKRAEYAYIQLLGLNINLNEILENLSPDCVYSCLSSLERQSNEKLYEEYDFQIVKNGEYVNSTINDLEFAKNFISKTIEALFI